MKRLASFFLVAFFTLSAIADSASPSNVLHKKLTKDELTRDWKLAVGASNPEALLELTRNIQRPSPFLPWSLLETARQEYQGERWAEFFGIAAYAREMFPKAVQTDKIRVLEILALIRHCEWDGAREKVVSGQPLVGVGVKEKFKVLADLLHVAPEVGAKESPKDKAAKPNYHFSSSTMWPVKPSDVTQLDPYRLRRKVKPKCDEQKEFEIKQNEQYEHTQE